MKSENNFKISLTELSFKGQRILAQQSATTLSKALAQVQQLKANSKVDYSLKKTRKTFS